MMRYESMLKRCEPLKLANPQEGLEAHILYSSERMAWGARLMDSDSGGLVGLVYYASRDDAKALALRFVQGGVA